MNYLKSLMKENEKEDRLENLLEQQVCLGLEYLEDHGQASFLKTGKKYELGNLALEKLGIYLDRQNCGPNGWTEDYQMNLNLHGREGSVG